MHASDLKGKSYIGLLLLIGDRVKSKNQVNIPISNVVVPAEIDDRSSQSDLATGLPVIFSLKSSIKG